MDVEVWDGIARAAAVCIDASDELVSSPIVSGMTIDTMSIAASAMRSTTWIALPPSGDESFTGLRRAGTASPPSGKAVSVGSE